MEKTVNLTKSVKYLNPIRNMKKKIAANELSSIVKIKE